MENKDYFIYVILCTGGSFYCGFTDNVKRRFEQHKKGDGAKYTKSHPPVRLLYSEKFSDKNSALKAEYAFKHQTRLAKENYLIQHGVEKNQWKQK